MKLVIIIPGGLDPGGRERIIPALMWLVERLARRHEVHVFATDSPYAPRSYQVGGAHIYELDYRPGPLPGVRMLQVWRRLMAALTVLNRSGPIDAIHGFWAGSSGVLAGLAGKRLRVPVVLSIGGGELVWLPEVGYGSQGRWRSRVQVQLALRLADAISGGSQYALAPLMNRQSAVQNWGVTCRLPTANCQLRCVPLGVDMTQFAAPVTRFGRPPWKVIHVGSLNRIKDQTTLLHALTIIVAHEPSVHLDWVGEDTLSGALQRLCVELGLATHVTFHGFLPSNKLAVLYRTAHLHLLSSRHESQAVVVGEAAAAGVPTVGTAVGIVAELAPDAAVAVPVGDARALAAAAVALLRDSARRERIGAAARSWSQRHDADWTAAEFERLYSELTCRS